MPCTLLRPTLLAGVAALALLAGRDAAAQPQGERAPSIAAPAQQGAQPANPAGPDAVRPDADMAAVLQALQVLGARSLEQLTVEQARRQPSPADAAMRVMREGNVQLPTAVRAVQARDLQVQGAAGMLPARLYVPGGQAGAGTGGMPLIVYWHGGGWVIADLDTYDATPRALAAETGAAVLSVHYRQAPEHRFPAAHEDAVAAWRWATANARELGADPRRMAVAGESAGGNLAINAALAARDGDLLRPVHVLAVYPIAGSDTNTPSYRENPSTVPLSAAGMAWFVRHVFENQQQVQDPRINLVGRDDLRGLPPTTIVLAQIDPLRSEGEALTGRLRDAGVDVASRTFEGVTHEFFGMAAVVADAKAAQSFAEDRLRAALANAPAGGQAAATPGQNQQAAAPAAQGTAGTTTATPAAMTANMASRLVGTNLVGADGRDVGEVVNLLLDRDGRVRGAVVEWGGFLGIGERRAVVPIERIRMGEGNDRARLEMTREQLDTLPRFDRDRLDEMGRQQGWGEGLRLGRN